MSSTVLEVETQPWLDYETSSITGILIANVIATDKPLPRVRFNVCSWWVVGEMHDMHDAKHIFPEDACLQRSRPSSIKNSFPRDYMEKSYLFNVSLITGLNDI